MIFYDAAVGTSPFGSPMDPGVRVLSLSPRGAYGPHVPEGGALLVSAPEVGGRIRKDLVVGGARYR